MNKNQKGFVNILFVLLVVILAGTVGYFALIKKPTTQVENSAPTGTVNNTSTTVTENKSLTLFGPLPLESCFEGCRRQYYQFMYPESDFSIATSSNGDPWIMIKELATGKTSTINASYEGGRGYEPNDYWNEVLKKTCSSCTRIANPVSIKDSYGLVTFANESKEWIIFGNGEWLFIAELQKPTTTVEKILSTSTFTPVK